MKRDIIKTAIVIVGAIAMFFITRHKENVAREDGFNIAMDTMMAIMGKQIENDSTMSMVVINDTVVYKLSAKNCLK